MGKTRDLENWRYLMSLYEIVSRDGFGGASWDVNAHQWRCSHMEAKKAIAQAECIFERGEV